ncbi:hypothetical protein CDL15_Pgr015892 [Punica granatum]|uniref:histidine kinase n=1 Tax=Punica granatum TaxID=22663 RepID=A0A218XQC1_PUNGR|nr:hypothetical protein CDL15_Pgr015892 [Punica granatum]
MVCEMEDDPIEDMEVEVLPSMWPEDIDPGKQFNIEEPGVDQDMLEEVTIPEKPTFLDLKWLTELVDFTDKGSAQLSHLVKHWEYKQANVVRLLREELDNLSRQRHEAELRELRILEEHRFEEDVFNGDTKRQISVLEDIYEFWKEVPRRKKDVIVENKRVEVDAEYDTVMYWKQRAMNLEKRLEASVQREQTLMEKLQESMKNLDGQSAPAEDLTQILKRADNFLHFILQTAPIVIGHQDKDLRYRFIYNNFPTLHEEDIIGKTDMEIFSGSGVKENQEFKREVLEKGKPAKREVTFETELFGLKTFLIYVEPVFNKAGETIGINYVGMEVTDQVKKREKMAKLREEIAVQKAKETELNKTIHITEETMRAKQMLATMSHEIRSPLSGVVSMAEILSTTRLDREQRQLLDVMLSSGDLVLQLINDILDLSKVESGLMKLEATKFRPREVVKHVLQTAAASLKKMLTLEGHVSDDVPIEVVGDVLRIRQILTNLISNAIKFTHEGKVGIKLYVIPEPSFASREGGHHARTNPEQSTALENTTSKEEKNLLRSHSNITEEHEDEEKPQAPQTTVWIRCDVYDTGIGIPENATPTLFKKYMQVSADHARKYGGTGLGLAICKQLVELMGGRLTVSSKEHMGSTFTFSLPYKVSPVCDNSDDSDELPNVAEDDITAGFFQFQPRALGSLFLNGPAQVQKLLPGKLNGFVDDSYMFPASNIVNLREIRSPEDACSVNIDAVESTSDPECSQSQSSHPDGDAANCKGTDSKPPFGNSRSQSSSSEIVSRIDSEERGSKVDNRLANGETLKEMQRLEKPETSPESTSSGKTESLKPEMIPRILLVEDNKINVMVTQSMMKQFKHKMDVVNNGVEAVRAVQRSSYDLILMDVCMPVMDGLQATRLIRSFEEMGNWEAATKAGIEEPSSAGLSPNEHKSSEPRKRIPIIAMTANALSESADECFANGMDSFVSKPVTLQKLKHCLEQYLR